MAIAKRIFLFLAVNILVVTTISIVLQLLHVGPYINRYGLDYQSLAVFCLVWGMGGAFISLFLSKAMVKWSMGVKIIDPVTTDENGRWLIKTVERLALAAGLTKTPEVGVYDSPEVNAFATGATRNSALVAVSTGLFQRMNKDEVEGVLGHELSHVANGDMVTMTLIQGVVNAFVMFLARALAFALTQGSGNRENRSSASPFFLTFILQTVFMIFGSMVVAWFSRWREFRADAGGANVAGNGKMIKALEKLQQMHGIVDPRMDKPNVAALKISGRNMMRLFATHPPLEERIARLRGY